MPKTTVQPAKASHTLSITIQKNSNMGLMFSNQALVLTFQKLENEAVEYDTLYKEKHQPDQGRYFKLADQKLKAEAHFYRGKRDACLEMLKWWQKQIGVERSLEVEFERARLRKLEQDRANEIEYQARCAQIKADNKLAKDTDTDAIDGQLM